jgi:L-threonylcarbamoyladenylate synthase
MKLLAPDAKGFEAAREAILRGEVVAYPTETVYGLGVNPFDEAALARLFATKRRAEGNPVLLIVSDPSELMGIASEVSPRAEAFIEAFWPGPLSLLLPRDARLSEAVTAGSEKVCVRCPACPIARKLCEVVGHGVTSTSANVSGEPPACKADDSALAGIAVVLDGGVLSGDFVSTVFDPDEGVVLREGAVPITQLEGVLGPLRSGAGS